VQILSRVDPVAESPVVLTLAQAVLKGEKMDDVVRDAVMLGVAAIHPIVTKRTETTVAAMIKGARLDRWRRIALASVKQSRRATLPEIRSPLRVEDFLDEPPAAVRLMLVEPGTSAAVEPIGSLRGGVTPADAAVLVGPEGGWSAEEWDAAASRGVKLISLGHRTLRADAVPVAAISVLQFLWNDLYGRHHGNRSPIMMRLGRRA
jgi:16S rRNA (uracil1498-N3)-methyltransferase